MKFICYKQIQFVFINPHREVFVKISIQIFEKQSSNKVLLWKQFSLLVCVPIDNFLKNFFISFVCFVLHVLFVISHSPKTLCLKMSREKREVPFSFKRMKQYVSENSVRSVQTHTTYVLFEYLLNSGVTLAKNLYRYLNVIAISTDRHIFCESPKLKCLIRMINLRGQLKKVHGI